MKRLYQINLFFVLLFSAVGVFGQQSEREKGIELYNQGDYAKAIEVLSKAAEALSADADLWLYVGMAEAKSGREGNAAKAFKKAEKLSAKTTSGTDTELKITRRVMARYTDEARRNYIQGRIKVAVEFLANGEIGLVIPFQTLPYGLEENTVEAVKKTEFEPAKKDGKPVTVIKIIYQQFTIY